MEPKKAYSLTKISEVLYVDQWKKYEDFNFLTRNLNKPKIFIAYQN
jgi:hypothetical protein